jgi:hypothetical protein
MFNMKRMSTTKYTLLFTYCSDSIALFQRLYSAITAKL